MVSEQKKTPGGEAEGNQYGISPSAGIDNSSLHESVDRAEFFAYQLHGLHVAVVEIKSPGPEKRFRRHYFANLPSAQRRVDKARESGREAHLYLGQIHIIGGDAR